MNNHQNKNYIIIGANGGIGSELVNSLSSLGANLHLIIRGESKNLTGKSYNCDASNFDDMLKIFEEIEKTCGKIDGVVNCAGSMLIKAAHLTSEEEFDNQINQNLKTAFSSVRAAGKLMSNYGGAVILISSSVADIGIYNHEAISAAKAGINGLVRSAASSYASNNLRFNALSLGLVETPMTEGLTNSNLALEVSISMHPLGRLGKAKDAVSMIIWLLDSDNDWVTGQIYNVDGGLSTVRTKIKL